MQKHCIYILFVLLLCSCKSPRKERLIIIHKETIALENDNLDNRSKGNAHGGQYFAHADKDLPYTPGLTYQLSDSLRGSFVRVCVDLYARMGGRRFGQSIVVSMQKGSDIKFWETYEINTHTFSKDKWVHIVDSSQFFYDMPSSDVQLKVFGFNAYKNSYLDIDDMHITIKKVVPLNDID